MRGGVISNYFLMLLFQNDSVDTVGSRTYGRRSGVLNQKVTFVVLNVPMGGGSGLGLSPKKYSWVNLVVPKN